MEIRTLVGAAPRPSPAQPCTALKKQFDQEITKHTTSSFATAKAGRPN